MQTGRNEGMITFESYVMELLEKGKLSAAVASDFLGKKVGAKTGGGHGPAGGNTNAGAKTAPGVPLKKSS